MEMIWMFGANVDLGKEDLEHDVEVGAGVEELEMENQVV
jgi:hypothetical protein